MMSWSNGTTDPSDQYQQRPPRNRFFESMRGSGWYRAQPRVIGGVCSGVAARTGWDMSLVRVLTVLAAFFIPVVPLAYALGWLLLPEAQDGRIHLEEALEGRFDIAVVGGIVLGLFSLSSLIPSAGLIFGGTGIGFGSFFALAIIGGLIGLIGLVYLVVASASSSNKRRGPGAPGQYGTPRYGTPQYGGQQGTSPAGDTAPFGGTTPSASGAGPASPGQTGPEHPAGYPFYGVPADSPSASGAPGAQAGPRPAAATTSAPHPGWTPPASAPTPRRWNVPPTPTHRPRTVSGRVNLAITGLLTLVTAAVFAGLYWADKGLSIPFITGETADQTIARIITIGGGVCLLVVGLSLAVAALRDRSAGWLTALSVIGIIMAFPTAAIGTQAARPTDFHINVRPGVINTETTRDWTVDRVSGGNPAGTTLLDLSGAPVGTTKTIIVDWEAWSRLTIQVAEGQPVQIVCQSDIETLSTNMDGDGWASSLNNCAGATATSPSWGKPSLGGITVLITDSAGLDTLTVLQTPDSSGTWGSKPTTTPSATPSATPSTTPSTSPSPTPTGSQSGN